MSAAGATSTRWTVMPLMSMPRIAAATAFGLVGAAGELHAAGLAAAADEDLRLDDDLAAARVEQPLRRRARLGRRGRDRPVRNGQSGLLEQGPGVELLELHTLLSGVTAGGYSAPACAARMPAVTFWQPWPSVLAVCPASRATHR